MPITLDRTLLNAENCAIGDLALRDAYVQSFLSDYNRFMVVDHYLNNHIHFDIVKFANDVYNASAPHHQGSGVEFCQRALTSLRAMGRIQMRPDHTYEVVPSLIDTKLPHEYKRDDNVLALIRTNHHNTNSGYTWVPATIRNNTHIGSPDPLFSIDVGGGCITETRNVIPDNTSNRVMTGGVIMNVYHKNSEFITLGRAPSGYGVVPRIGDLDYFEINDVVQYHFPLDIGNGKSGNDVYNLKQYGLKDGEQGTIIGIDCTCTYGPMTIHMDSGTVVQCALPNRLSLREYSHPFRLASDKPARLR